MIDLPDDYDQQRARTAHRSEVAKLRAEVRELKKRIRLARNIVRRPYTTLATAKVPTRLWLEELDRVLSLRRKLPRRSR